MEGAGVNSWNMLFLSLLPPEGEESSHSFSAPAQGLYHWIQSPMNFTTVNPSPKLQLSLNCSSMGPFHRVQFFECLLSWKLLEASGSTSDVMASAWGSSLLKRIWGWWASRPRDILFPGLLEHGYCDPLSHVCLGLNTHTHTHINLNTRMMPLQVSHTQKNQH